MAVIQLVRAVELPPELHAAVATNRPELCKALKRKLKPEEQAKLVDALAVFIQTIHGMQNKIDTMRTKRTQLRAAITTCLTNVRKNMSDLYTQLSNDTAVDALFEEDDK